MTLRNLILAETINQEKILTEDKVSAFVKNVLDRYSNIRAPRIEAVYSKEIYNKTQRIRVFIQMIIKLATKQHSKSLQ